MSHLKVSAETPGRFRMDERQTRSTREADGKLTDGCFYCVKTDNVDIVVNTFLRKHTNN